MTKHVKTFELARKSAAENDAPDLTALIKNFDEALGKIQGKAEEAIGKATKGENIASGVKEQLDEALLGFNGIKSQLADIEQKLAARSRAPVAEGVKSMGAQFVESAEFKSLAGSAQQRGKASVEIKAELTSLTTNAAGSVGSLRVNDRRPDVITSPQRRLRIRDLLMVIPTASATIEYDKETGFTNGAGMVAEGSAAPQSDIKTATMTAAVRTIAHHFKAARNVLADAPRLQALIDNKATYFLDFKEEDQLLNGSGAGENLNGIVTQATAYAAPFTIASATVLDQLRLALLQAALAEYPADGIVLNPIDWARCETLKDGQGRYIIGNPQGNIAPTLWGEPVVATQSITVDKFLVGAFGMGAELYDRLENLVEVATENEDDFIKRKITILAAKRVALAVTRPESFIYGDLGFVA